MRTKPKLTIKMTISYSRCGMKLQNSGGLRERGMVYASPRLMDLW